MSHFCLLKDPGQYCATNWDLLTDPASREFWLAHFQNQFAETMKHAVEQYGRLSHKRTQSAAAEFQAALAALDHPPAPGGVNMIAMDTLRAEVLRKHGLEDPYKNIRSRANDAALEAYPQVVHDLHPLNRHDKFMRLMQDLFAGNTLDLGSPATAHLANQPFDFDAAVKAVKPRPWLVDDLDLLEKHMAAPPPLKWSKAVIFVDNAGADFILGVMPLAREMALYGTKIVLAANERPALNDMTADETIVVVERLAEIDEDLAAMIKGEMFEVVSSGNTIPVMDLGNVSDELNAAAADAELVIVEGMGRAIETNYDAAFSTDCLKAALVKNPAVARRIGGQLYDCVCRYVPV